MWLIAHLPRSLRKPQKVFLSFQQLDINNPFRVLLEQRVSFLFQGFLWFLFGFRVPFLFIPIFLIFSEWFFVYSLFVRELLVTCLKVVLSNLELGFIFVTIFLFFFSDQTLFHILNTSITFFQLIKLCRIGAKPLYIKSSFISCFSILKAFVFDSIMGLILHKSVS